MSIGAGRSSMDPGAPSVLCGGGGVASTATCSTTAAEPTGLTARLPNARASSVSASAPERTTADPGSASPPPPWSASLEWVWLAVRSNPLQPGGVCHRAKESAVDKRLKHLLSDIRRIPRVRLDNNDVAGHGCDGGIRCGGEFFLSLPHSRFFLAFSLGSLFSPLLPGARCSGDGSTEVAGKVR